MLSKGQLIFAVLFAIGFIIIMVYSYRQDKGIHLKQYKGSLKILLGFLIFVTLLVIIKFLLSQ
ncbi:hypothetical protein [Robertkochia aurantiaca]|uniref:hypothetical protein n=1 Tax=Robertkochia aurantiaca TaxID=2873700 RepID=UPI001CC8EE07|nr:hypothetical protein [Robertkochia sp. 3YJGBD-33]